MHIKNPENDKNLNDLRQLKKRKLRKEKKEKLKKSMKFFENEAEVSDEEGKIKLSCDDDSDNSDDFDLDDSFINDLESSVGKFLMFNLNYCSRRTTYTSS